MWLHILYADYLQSSALELLGDLNKYEKNIEKSYASIEWSTDSWVQDNWAHRQLGPDNRAQEKLGHLADTIKT